MANAKRYSIQNGQLCFEGMVKIKPPFKPKSNPTVDHVMSNIHDHETQKSTETSGMVTLRVPSSGDDNRPLDISLNGQNYSLPRDVTATVPREIADIIINSQSSKSVVPAARGEKLICQVDPNSGTYLNGKGPVEIENRRWNVIVEDET